MPIDIARDMVWTIVGMPLLPKKDLIKKVIYNDPATIVLWSDGTKTVVKAHDEPFDPEKGLAMAIAKKALGNGGSYYETFKEWLPKTNTQDELIEKLERINKEITNGFENALKISFDNMYKVLGHD